MCIYAFNRALCSDSFQRIDEQALPMTLLCSSQITFTRRMMVVTQAEIPRAIVDPNMILTSIATARNSAKNYNLLYMPDDRLTK